MQVIWSQQNATGPFFCKSVLTMPVLGKVIIWGSEALRTSLPCISDETLCQKLILFISILNFFLEKSFDYQEKNSDTSPRNIGFTMTITVKGFYARSSHTTLINLQCARVEGNIFILCAGSWYLSLEDTYILTL